MLPQGCLKIIQLRRFVFRWNIFSCTKFRSRLENKYHKIQLKCVSSLININLTPQMMRMLQPFLQSSHDDRNYLSDT